MQTNLKQLHCSFCPCSFEVFYEMTFILNNQILNENYNQYNNVTKNYSRLLNTFNLRFNLVSFIIFSIGTFNNTITHLAVQYLHSKGSKEDLKLVWMII